MGPRWLSGELTDDRGLLNLAGLALPITVWLLGLILPPRGGLSPGYIVSNTALLATLVAVDRTTPAAAAQVWRRLVWLGAEIALSLLIVWLQGNLVRPALIYLLPTSRALLMFGGRGGLFTSISVWIAYSANIFLNIGPSRLGEFPNYLSFFLAPYIVGVVLTFAAIRQAADRRRLQVLYDDLRKAHEQLQVLHEQARTAAVNQERNRLAREIHDSLAHFLTVINLQLEAAEKLGEAQARRAFEQVRHARRLTLDCLREVRRSVGALRATTLEELSLERALTKLVADFSDSTGIAVSLELNLSDGLEPAADARLALYRVAQEGLTNVQRHAHATSVRLALSAADGSASIVVDDDGRGPVAEVQPETSGFGLLGLRERVELLGGRLSFSRRASGGSELAATLPLHGPA